MNDIPRRLGDRYEVGELLGRGGMAEVHLSRDGRLGRLVAVKMLRADLARDAVFQARFRREAQSAAALNHPMVVAVYDTGEDVFTEHGGNQLRLPYIVMEYVEGKTARDLLLDAGGSNSSGHGGGGVGTERSVHITSGVLTALDYSHRQGIIHRDIKPANVMVTPDDVVKVMDFGIARALADTSATMTQTSAVIGTAQYLSPEQARGETVDARSDLYSSGCLLYELLTGRPPFVGDSPVSVAYQHVREVPEPPSRYNPAVDEALDRVVLKSLAKDREDRYDDAEQFRRDLLAAADGRAVSAPGVAAAAAATRVVPSSAAATRALGVTGAAATTALPATGGPAPEDADPFAALGAPAAERPRQREPEPKKRTGLVLGIVLAVLVALALGAVAVWYTQDSDDPPVPTVPAVVQVAVPDLTTGDADDARSLLRDADLVYEEVEAPDDEVAAGDVVSQDPPAGTQVDAGSTVTVTVSTGPESVAVPEVAGQSEAQARSTLDRAGLVDGDLVEEADADVPEGTVIRTDPAAGADVAPGSSVTIFVSTGQVQLEDLTGLSVTDASAALTELGLVPKVTYEASDQPENTVVRQDPGAGAVAPGSEVALVAATPQPEEEEPSADPSASPSSSGEPGSGTPGGGSPGGSGGNQAPTPTPAG